MNLCYDFNDPASNTPQRCLRSHSMKAPSHSPLARDAELIGLIVSSVFHIQQSDLFIPHRGIARIALARQVAMYLTHIICGLSYTDVGLAFGRDRTTVSHACQLVEDRREDPDFDWSLDLLERALVLLNLNSTSEV